MWWQRTQRPAVLARRTFLSSHDRDPVTDMTTPRSGHQRNAQRFGLTTVRRSGIIYVTTEADQIELQDRPFIRDECGRFAERVVGPVVATASDVDRETP